MLNNHVKSDNVSTFFKNKVDLLVKSGYNSLDNEIIFTNDITQCDRRLFYKVSDQYSKSYLVKMHNEALSKKWRAYLEKVKGVDVLATNFTVADHNCGLTGIVNLIISASDKKILVMIKEVDNDFFNSKRTVRKHIVDIMSQMWLAEIDDGLLIYENVETKEFSMYHILTHPSVLMSVDKKAKDIQRQKVLGVLPERKYDSKTSSECVSCEFKEKCWNV